MIFVIMEELTGPELFSYMQDNAPRMRAFSPGLMKQLLAAVSHVHSVGIVHRDVKVEAMRFRNADNHADLVLFDFGHCGFSGVNEPRTIIGTATYMAPEQFSTRYDTQVDVWACGVIFYIMLTGRLPFDPEKKASPPTTGELQAALSISILSKVGTCPRELLSRLMTW